MTETFTADEVADVFWDYLAVADLADDTSGADGDDRRMTAWGTKTKLGLALTIRRLGAGLRVPLSERSRHTDEKGNPE